MHCIWQAGDDFFTHDGLHKNVADDFLSDACLAISSEMFYC